MKIPLLAAVLLAASFCSAQSEAETYPAVFDAGVKQSAQAFLLGEPLPVVPGPETSEDIAKYARQFENYSALAAQAAYVQSGRGPEDDAATYDAMIVHVAKKLGISASEALKRYSGLRRSAAQQQAALAENALRAGLIAQMLENKKLTPAAHAALAKKMQAAKAALMRQLINEGSAGTAAEAQAVLASRQSKGDATDLKNMPPRVKPYSFRGQLVPSAPPPGSEGGILAYLDNSRAMELARLIKAKAVGFKGTCYAYVKKGLDLVYPSWRSLFPKDQSSAYEFATSLNKDPKLFDKLKLRKLPASEIVSPLPVGAIIVYGRGICGFSAEHGHIEVVVSSKPPRTCSDGCMPLPEQRMTCIKRNAPKGGANVYIPIRS